MSSATYSTLTTHGADLRGWSFGHPCLVLLLLIRWHADADQTLWALYMIPKLALTAEIMAVGSVCGFWEGLVHGVLEGVEAPKGPWW